MKTTHWTVPKGETWSVDERGLTVIASSDINIDGTLLVRPGSRIAFFAPTFALSGRIYIPQKLSIEIPLRTAKPAANDVISACEASFGNGAGDSPGYYQLVIPYGDNLYVTASKKACHVRENGIALLNGSPETLPSRRCGWRARVDSEIGTAGQSPQIQALPEKP